MRALIALSSSVCFCLHRHDDVTQFHRYLGECSRFTCQQNCTEGQTPDVVIRCRECRGDVARQGQSSQANISEVVLLRKPDKKTCTQLTSTLFQTLCTSSSESDAGSTSATCFKKLGCVDTTRREVRRSKVAAGLPGVARTAATEYRIASSLHYGCPMLVGVSQTRQCRCPTMEGGPCQTQVCCKCVRSPCDQTCVNL